MKPNNLEIMQIDSIFKLRQVSCLTRFTVASDCHEGAAFAQSNSQSRTSTLYSTQALPTASATAQSCAEEPQCRQQGSVTAATVPL